MTGAHIIFVENINVVFGEFAIFCKILQKYDSRDLNSDKGSAYLIFNHPLISLKTCEQFGKKETLKLLPLGWEQ